MTVRIRIPSWGPAPAVGVSARPTAMGTRLYTSSASGLHVDLIRDRGPEWEACEQDLAAAGTPLPLYHRCIWTASFSGCDAWFLAVRDESGRCRGGLGVEVRRSRALPGHVLLTANRVGYGALPGDVAETALAGLARLARRFRRVLRVNVRLFARTDRAALQGPLRSLGFRKVKEPSCYRHTLAMNLTTGDEAALLASLHRSARRNIREVTKLDATVRPVTDPSYADQINRLMRDALERTGGSYRAHDWTGPIRLSNERPDLSHFVGLFRKAPDGPDELLAFAWGMNHGDHSEYNAAGSVRLPDCRVPMGYALLWELVRWSKAQGVPWMDMGGVTLGTAAGGDDPLGGISDFKRYFTKDLVEVGEEWTLEPHRIQATLARAVSAGAGWLSRQRAHGPA